MKDRDHNEAMASLFQAEPRFAADYLRQVLADGELTDLRTGLRQMGDVLRVSQVAARTDSVPSTGLFDRAGVRYEVACDVIGALIAHYAEIMGREREQAQPNEAVLRVDRAMKGALAGERVILTRVTAPASRRRFRAMRHWRAVCTARMKTTTLTRSSAASISIR
ncbi:MAG TPA: hypothetical protein PLC55_06255 [Zoogloea sp.]|nr:hypothetical protein [Zoogloea sp.]